MSICYHEGSREFHLYNKEISYLITILKNGQLGQLYFGKKLHDRESFSHLLRHIGFMTGSPRLQDCRLPIPKIPKRHRHWKSN